MSWEKIASILRHILTFGGGFIVAKGWVSEATVQSAIGVIITLGGIVWGQFNKTEASLVSMAADVPGTIIVTTPALAAGSQKGDVKSSADTKIVNK